MRKVSTLFRLRRELLQTGDVGVEIEMEGAELPHDLLHWKIEHDGSLQANPMALEYVFRSALDLDKTKKALEELSKGMKKNHCQPRPSIRCGVHVHVNVQELTLIELYNYFTAYLALEPILVRYCGESREGNLFCLRATDAYFLVHKIIEASRTKEFYELFNDDDLRYAAMNVTSLPKYGSLEFRSMRTTEEPLDVLPWASGLLFLRDFAKGFANPTDLVAQLSAGGHEKFIKDALPGLHTQILQWVDCEKLLYEGVRLAQDVAFSCDWTAVKEVKTINPFLASKVGF